MQHPIMLKRFKIDRSEELKDNLLDTIKLPMNLMNLNGKLPKP